jgi:hypothetical protein
MICGTSLMTKALTPARTIITKSTGTWIALKNNSDFFINKNLLNYSPIFKFKIYQSKTISRILSRAIIYLDPMSPLDSSGTLPLHSSESTKS